MSFDNVCKLLAEKYPLDFATWLLPQAPKTIKVLKTELSIEPIRADFVSFLQTENRILHLEFQTKPKSKQDIAAYTEILAGLRFEKDFIRQLLSEDIMKESVIYQDIFQKGEQRGEQKGEIKFCLMLLNQRFGSLDSQIIERVKALSVEKLESLGAALFNISELADLVTWLNQQDHH